MSTVTIYEGRLIGSTSHQGKQIFSELFCTNDLRWRRFDLIWFSSANCTSLNQHLWVVVSLINSTFVIQRNSAEVKPKTKGDFKKHLVIYPDGNVLWLDTNRNNQHPNSALPIYTESTPKAKRRVKKRTGSTCNVCINRHEQQEQTGSTFSETGVVSQARVGEYCTSVYKKKEKKKDQHDDSKDVFTRCFKYLERESPCQSTSISKPRSVSFAVDRKFNKQRFFPPLLPIFAKVREVSSA